MAQSLEESLDKEKQVQNQPDLPVSKIAPLARDSFCYVAQKARLSSILVKFSWKAFTVKSKLLKTEP